MRGGVYDRVIMRLGLVMHCERRLGQGMIGNGIGAWEVLFASVEHCIDADLKAM